MFFAVIIVRLRDLEKRSQTSRRHRLAESGSAGRKELSIITVIQNSLEPPVTVYSRLSLLCTRGTRLRVIYHVLHVFYMYHQNTGGTLARVQSSDTQRVTAVCHSFALSLLFQLVSRGFQTSCSLSLGVFLNRPSKLQVKKPILSHPLGQSLSPSNPDISPWVYSIPLCHTGSVRSRQDGNVEWADYVSKLLIMWALAYSLVTREYCPFLLPCLPWRQFLPILSSY